ncbi:hypothetical protein J0X15_13290 [Roseibium sp. CAU 1637]|uniref:Dicarboxylate transport domain-containing protein n=1 Tax=Roseibium limicola TaxID=2816037 RepID=A0A939EQP3_9HYPH|nr:hypothetical protein [Roseibium limicola]MBO0346201.1 hypothetical protein [Roseibium limicola]
MKRLFPCIHPASFLAVLGLLFWSQTGALAQQPVANAPASDEAIAAAGATSFEGVLKAAVGQWPGATVSLKSITPVGQRGDFILKGLRLAVPLELGDAAEVRFELVVQCDAMQLQDARVDGNALRFKELTFQSPLRIQLSDRNDPSADLLQSVSVSDLTIKSISVPLGSPTSDAIRTRPFEVDQLTASRMTAQTASNQTAETIQSFQLDDLYASGLRAAQLAGLKLNGLSAAFPDSRGTAAIHMKTGSIALEDIDLGQLVRSLLRSAKAEGQQQPAQTAQDVKADLPLVRVGELKALSVESSGTAPAPEPATLALEQLSFHSLRFGSSLSEVSQLRLAGFDLKRMSWATGGFTASLESAQLSDIGPEFAGWTQVEGLVVKDNKAGSLSLEHAYAQNLQVPDIYTSVRSSETTRIPAPSVVDILKSLAKTPAVSVSGLTLDSRPMTEASGNTPARFTLEQGTWHATTAQSDIPMSAELRLNGMTLPIGHLIPKGLREALALSDTEDLRLDHIVRLDWDQQTESYQLAPLRLSLDGLIDLELTARLSNVPAMAFSSPALAPILIAGAPLEGLTLRLRAGAALGRYLEKTAKQSGLSVEDLANAWVGNRSTPPELQDRLAEALRAERPIKLELTPTEGISLFEIVRQTRIGASTLLGQMAISISPEEAFDTAK